MVVRAIGVGLAFIAFTTLLATSSARAQTENGAVPAERFRPAIDREGLIDVEWAGVGRHFDLDAGLMLGYALNPLVLYRDGVRADALIAHRFGGNVVAAVGLLEWVKLGVDIPVVLFQTRDIVDDVALTDVSALGAGDVRFVPKVRVLRAEDQIIDVAIIPAITLPTGFPQGSYLSDGNFTFAPELAVSMPIARLARVAVNAGYRLRNESEVLGLNLGSEIFYRAGAGVMLHDALKVPIEIDATVNGATLAASPFSSGFNENPLEALAGVKLDLFGDFQATGYVGAGLVAGYGVPDARAGVGFRFAPRDRDKDDDGIDDDKDKCKTNPEDKDGFEDADGCPERDNDVDGMVDEHDGCPNDAEDFDSVQDADGCPDPDNDADGTEDKEDRCPMTHGPFKFQGCPDGDGDQVPDIDDACAALPGPVENKGCPLDRDRDQIVDNDDACPDAAGPAHTKGCPDRDGDGITDDKDRCPDVAGLPVFAGCADGDKDGIADPDDKCPTEPETINGTDDTDGCPDQGRSEVKLTKEKIEILEKVFFDVDKATIQKRSFPLLLQVALVLKANPQIKKLRVEGHTDSQGEDAYNMELSQKRAEAVRQFLVEAGVPPEALEAQGFGETRPIADNKTRAGQANNRRVEFVIVEQ